MYTEICKGGLCEGTLPIASVQRGRGGERARHRYLAVAPISRVEGGESPSRPSKSGGGGR